VQAEKKKVNCIESLAKCHTLQTIGAPTSIILTIFVLDALLATTIPIYLSLGQEPSMLGCRN